MNAKNQYAIYFANLENDVMISIIKMNFKSRSINSVIIKNTSLTENLWKAIRKIILDNKIEKKDISLCYVNNGPAKFNANRLTVLSAKSFAYFNNIPLYKISNLFLHYLEFNKPFALNADNSQYYLAYYNANNSFVETAINKDDFNQYCKDHNLEDCELQEYLTLEQHESLVLKKMEKFALVDDVADLETNYVKDPVIG